MRRCILALAVVAFLSCEQAYAQNVMCSGKIQSLGVDGSGRVFVNNGHGVWAICSLTSAERSVAPGTCRAWYLSLLSSRATQSQIGLYVSGYGSCNLVGSWVSANVYFVD